MINELSLLKLNPGIASTKQKIIDILSNEWPLSAKSIHAKLRKQYSAEISYQATHKTIKELEETKVIERKTEGYLLNIEYIRKSKKSFEDVEKKYLKNERIIIPENFQDTIEIEFDTLTDLGVSTAELLISKQLAKGSNDPSVICTMEYGLWSFKIRFEHLQLLYEVMKNNPKAISIIRTKTPFGEWVRNQYIKVGGISAPIGTKVDIDEEIFVQGDCIIEIKFSKESKKILEHYYNKLKNINDAFKEFGLKPEPKIQATMRITKNHEMAHFLRKQLNKVFEAKKND
jgi:DNA-binding Lrp family transcriptional regulator